MPLSTDIKLPRNATPVFPDRCVVCGADGPSNTVKLTTHTIGWWTWTLWVFTSLISVRVPACKKCGWMLKFYRWGGVLILLIAGGLLATWLGPTISEYVPKGLRRWAMIGVIILCLLPYFIWQACFPPPFDITAFREHVDYEFKDKEYAREFLQLNPSGVKPDD